MDEAQEALTNAGVQLSGMTIPGRTMPNGKQMAALIRSGWKITSRWKKKLKALASDKENVLEREQNTRAGFVYIISNIGSLWGRCV